MTMIVSKTPLRISFAGGGTDLPSFYMNNEYGAVFSSSINKYIYVTVKRHSNLYQEKIRLNYFETELVDDVEDISNPIIRECLKFLEIDEGIYISTVADAPASSGLGSSSTFCVGLLKALYAYTGQSVNGVRLAEEAAHIEIDLLQRPIGKQDHYAATFGGLNYFQFNEDGTSSIKPMINNDRIVQSLFGNLLTFWTGIERKSEEILTEQNDNTKLNSPTLIEIRDQALQFCEAVKNNDLNMETLGTFLHKGWKLKKTLASNISNSFIEQAYSSALENGAIGGKISGAGGGGFLSLVVPSPYRSTILSEMAKLGLNFFPVFAETEGCVVHNLY